MRASSRVVPPQLLKGLSLLFCTCMDNRPAGETDLERCVLSHGAVLAQSAMCGEEQKIRQTASK